MQTVVEDKVLVPAPTIDRATRELIEIVKNKRSMSFASKAAREIRLSLNLAQVEGLKNKMNKQEVKEAFFGGVKAKGYFVATSAQTDELLREFWTLAYAQPKKGGK